MASNSTTIKSCPITKVILQSEDNIALINTIFLVILDINPAIITVIANVVLIVTIVKTQSLHTPSNVLIGALCVSDFLVGIVSQPFFLALLLKARSGKDFRPMDSLFVLSLVIFGGMSFILVLAITIDRFIAICHPFQYSRFASCKKYTLLAIISSIVPVAVMFISKVVYYWVSILTIFTAIPVIICCYISIYGAIRKQNKTILSIGAIGEEARRKLKENQEQKKTASTLMIICGFFVFCYSPMLILAAVNRGPSNVCRLEPKMFVIFTWTMFLLLLNSFINPMVYCFRMKAIRDAVKNVFRCRVIARVHNGML